MRKVNQITNIISFLMMAAYLILFASVWEKLPDTIPTHYNVTGQADAYGQKVWLLLIPGVMLLMFLLLVVVEHFPQVWNMPVRITEENRERQYLIGAVLLGITKISCIAIFSIIDLPLLIPGFPFWTLWVVLGVMFAAIIGCIIWSIKAR